jgi:hypothetical protein
MTQYLGYEFSIDAYSCACMYGVKACAISVYASFVPFCGPFHFTNETAQSHFR